MGEDKDDFPHMFTALNDHTIEPDLLPERPTVLDVGCRGFGFGDAIRQLRPSAVIHELDIDILNTSRPYWRAALAEYDGAAGCSDEADPLRRHIVPGGDVPVYTIRSFSPLAGVVKWDVIKLDCEGSEYEILKSFDRPWARQLTVEFHQHTPFRKEWREIDAIILHLSKWYDVVQHKIETRWGLAENYWDSLLISK
jgi:methyltransferase FkbM-like protein